MPIWAVGFLTELPGLSLKPRCTGDDGVTNSPECLGKMLVLKGIVHLLALLLGLEHTSRAKDREMPRDNGHIDGEASRELANGTGSAPLREKEQKPDPVRIGERLEEVVGKQLLQGSQRFGIGGLTTCAHVHKYAYDMPQSQGDADTWTSEPKAGRRKE